MEQIINNENISWADALKQQSFKRKLYFGVACITCIVLFLPFFFQYIEQRDGYIINDLILQWLPAADVSFILFPIIWITSILMLIRSGQNPHIFLITLYSLLLLLITRITTIILFPLNPPAGLIPLTDPIISIFYGKSFITKDLFYSGHTATQFLFYLCFRRKADKLLALFGTVAVGVLVLVQHVHYTIDVIAAPLFSLICYAFGKYIVKHN